MHFGFTEDEQAVRDAVAALLGKRAGPDYLQRAWAAPGSDEAWAPWSELAGMGVHGLLAPEAVGGSGLGWVAATLVLAEVGRAGFPLPVLETAAVGLPAVMAAGDPLGVASALADGSDVLTVASGPAMLAPAVSRADWFLVAADGVVSLHHRDQVEITPESSVDRTRDLGRIRTDGPGTVLPGVTPESVGSAGALGAAAVLVGLGRALVDMTVGYVKDRKQFGVPVGSFQAVKHHLADAALHVEFAAPAVWAAAWEMDAAPPSAGRTGDHSGSPGPSVALAKALASEAATLAARKALQCHGAMGYTDDYHLHMWLKRVWCLAAAYGSPGFHRRLIGAGLGLAY